MLLRKENKRQEKLQEMKIVLLERNSAGTDVPVDCFNELGEVTSYPNTVTAQEVAERVGDADVIVCNKAPMKEESLKDCPNVKLICELATGYDNCDLAYCRSRGIKVANVVDYSTAMVALLKESDFLSLHCPLSDLSRNFIDKEALRKMKKTAILINVARGPVVNNADLYEALVAGEIQAAGLDVLEKEPLELSNPLSQLKDSNKLIITPHLAWASVEARTRCVQGVYENIKAFMRGENRNVVNL